MCECMCVLLQNDSGHSLGGGDPLTKFKRQMSLTTKGCITPSGMEEQLRSLLRTCTHTPDSHAVLSKAPWRTVCWPQQGVTQLCILNAYSLRFERILSDHTLQLPHKA